jgi:hypothetical protein
MRRDKKCASDFGEELGKHLLRKSRRRWWITLKLI